MVEYPWNSFVKKADIMATLPLKIHSSRIDEPPRTACLRQTGVNLRQEVTIFDPNYPRRALFDPMSRDYRLSQARANIGERAEDSQDLTRLVFMQFGTPLLVC